MSYVVVLFPEPREVYIDDEGQGSNVAASGRPRLLFVNAGKHTFRLTGADVLPAEQTLDVPEQPILDPFPRVPEVLTRAMRLIAVGLALVAGLTVAGCAVPANPRLAAYGAAGYRYANVRTDAGEEELFVILAFSGGGTRAAAFSYGVLDGL